MKRVLVWIALVAVCVACGRRAHGDTPTGVADASQTQSSDGPAIGKPAMFDNLTVFPVTSKSQADIGPIASLDDALSKGTAVVREVGAETSRDGSGAQVNSLVIQNKGKVAVYVLAGTIVKGGKQDRQIGDDFVVGPGQTVPVDAFCVEHGRWTTERNGVATGGKFGTVGLLTESSVRSAAQYERNQSEVWSKVAAVNAANRKSASSGTLMATVDSGDVVAKRTALAQKVTAYVEGMQPAEDVVGLAYALDGKVRSVRWFANHKVFETFRSTLVSTAAQEAITSQSVAVASGRPTASAPPVPAEKVAQFVKDVATGKLKEHRDTAALNENDVRESSEGYSATTVLKAQGPRGAAKPRPVSTSATSF